MKKILAMGALCCTVLTAYSQRKGLWIMPQATYGLGKMKDFYPASMGYNHASFWSLGLEIQKMFTPHTGLAFGLSYGRYRLITMQYSAILMHPGDARLVEETVDVPLYGRWLIGGDNGIFIHAGIVNSIKVSGSQTLKIVEQGQRIEVPQNEIPQTLKHYSAMPFLYCGGSIATGKALLTVGPMVQYQPGNNFKESSGQKGHYLFVALKVGVCLHGGQKQTRKETEVKEQL